MAKVKWTEEIYDKIRKMYFDDKTDEEIADEFNTTKNSICRIKRELGLNNVCKIDWDEKEIKEYFIKQLIESKDIVEAVNKTGFGKATIIKKLKYYLGKKEISFNLYKKLIYKFDNKVIKF